VDGQCPAFEWYIGSSSNRLDPWNYFYRNCTSYVAWRSARMGLEVPGLGNGGQWANNSWRHRELSTGTTPRIGSFAVFTTGGYGHVAYVEDVSGDEVLISEYNFVADGVHSRRWIPSTQPTRYVYTPWSR
jgi:surface antigen